MDKELLKGHLPVLILGLLADEPMHGYALCQAIKRKGGDQLALGDGTIYPLLYRLEERGQVESSWETHEGRKPKRVYRITDSGLKSIRQHQADWRTLNTLFTDFLGEEWATS